jgi:DNA-binding XRE family transcriptional regulator
MEYQDWTVVTLKRKSADSRDKYDGKYSFQEKEKEKEIKKKIESSSIQDLIRKRIEMKLTQEKADQFCQFPKYTFKNIESNRVLPTPTQHSSIQKQFGIQLRISH